MSIPSIGSWIRDSTSSTYNKQYYQYIKRLNKERKEVTTINIGIPDIQMLDAFEIPTNSCPVFKWLKHDAVQILYGKIFNIKTNCLVIRSCLDNQTLKQPNYLKQLKYWTGIRIQTFVKE
jgi:hypothetical protein